MPASPPSLISFSEACARSERYTKRHVVLGNGFSIACKPNIFAYKALFDRAQFASATDLTRRVFDVLDTHDFEEVMRALRDAAKLVRSVDPKYSGLAADFTRAVRALRQILVGTIARQHPESPAEISSLAYQACRKFLSHFDNIYTLSYDLLLYWALMQDELKPKISHDDGFRTPETGVAEYVTWEVEQTDHQNVFYLHGALHLFDAGAELKKFTWINTGIRLIEQIREALEHNLFPLIVAEGTSQQKKAKIMHSNYLSRGYRSLPKVGGAIFLFGHSLAEKDEHILRLIEIGNSRHAFIGVHGDPGTPANAKLIRRGRALRGHKSNRKVEFFEASSAHVWG